MESRTLNVKKNIFFQYISTILTVSVSIVSRTIFIRKLGVEYLGVSGLFSNLLGILAFSELGIGTAINFSLYKPIAENDNETIKSLLALYKTAYRIIAFIITAGGLVIVPVLKYLVNTDLPMQEVFVYYFVFLFNTVSSYFITYKTAYVAAMQKDYIITNVSTVGNLVVSGLQIACLLAEGTYFHYLLIAAVLGLVQKIIMVIFLNHKYPILTEKNVLPIESEKKAEIWKNVRALIIHKVGDVSVHQTDNIIVSAFISTASVGLISNYIVLTSLVSKFTNGLFNSFTASIGNLIAKDSKTRQREIFETYDLIGYWVFGFVFVAFVTLAQPFIVLWLGEELLVDELTMVLFFVSGYLTSMTLTTYNFKVAAGRFDEDKWVAFAQAVTNLVVSIAAVKLIGLPGVYVGTIVQRLIVVAVRPYIVYRYILEDNVWKYYIRFVFRTVLVFLMCGLLWMVKKMILTGITINSFAVMVAITAVLPNLIFLLLYGKTPMFKDIIRRIRR